MGELFKQLDDALTGFVLLGVGLIIYAAIAATYDAFFTDSQYCDPVKPGDLRIFYYGPDYDPHNEDKPEKCVFGTSHLNTTVIWSRKDKNSKIVIHDPSKLQYLKKAPE